MHRTQKDFYYCKLFSRQSSKLAKLLTHEQMKDAYFQYKFLLKAQKTVRKSGHFYFVFFKSTFCDIQGFKQKPGQCSFGKSFRAQETNYRASDVTKVFCAAAKSSSEVKPDAAGLDTSYAKTLVMWNALNWSRCSSAVLQTLGIGDYSFHRSSMSESCDSC